MKMFHLRVTTSASVEERNAFANFLQLSHSALVEAQVLRVNIWIEAEDVFVCELALSLKFE